MEASIKSLQSFFQDRIYEVYPHVPLFDYGRFSIEDVVNHFVFNSILKEYYSDAQKDTKPLEQHLHDHYDEPDSVRRMYTRTRQYSQFFRSALHDDLLSHYGHDVDFLKEKNMQDRRIRRDGHPLSRIDFEELMNIHDYPIFKKITGRQIIRKKKVPDKDFIEYHSEYRELLMSLENASDNPESILRNSVLYRNMELNYCIDLVYQLASAAAYKHIQTNSDVLIPTDRIRPLCATYYECAKSEWNPCPDPITFVRNDMLIKRLDYCSDVFSGSDFYWNQQIILFQHLFEIQFLILRHKYITKDVHKCLSEISMEDKAAFIQENYWFWDSLTDYQWTPKKISYARKIYDLIIKNQEMPHNIK